MSSLRRRRYGCLVDPGCYPDWAAIQRSLARALRDAGLAVSADSSSLSVSRYLEVARDGDDLDRGRGLRVRISHHEPGDRCHAHGEIDYDLTPPVDIAAVVRAIGGDLGADPDRVERAVAAYLRRASAAARAAETRRSRAHDREAALRAELARRIVDAARAAGRATVSHPLAAAAEADLLDGLPAATAARIRREARAEARSALRPPPPTVDEVRAALSAAVAQGLARRSATGKSWWVGDLLIHRRELEERGAEVLRTLRRLGMRPCPAAAPGVL